MIEQLPLGLQLRSSARFSNFVPGANAELLTQLKQVAEGGAGSQVFCWGAEGTGKTHLLQACCQFAATCEHTAVYLSLADFHQLAPELLNGWDVYRLVCLDDFEAIAGRPDWEEAVFHLYNRVQQAGGSLVVSAAVSPTGLDLHLPDLASRLAAGLVYQLQRLDDAQSLAALTLRAQQRGFDLPEETGRYLLRRLPRNLPALMGMLERLDNASLAAQRRLTVPFVKTVLDL